MLRSSLRDCCRWEWSLCNLKAQLKMSGFAFTSRSCSNEPPLASTWMVASTAATPTSPPFLEFNQYSMSGVMMKIIVNLHYKIKQFRFLFVWHKRKSWQWNGYNKSCVEVEPKEPSQIPCRIDGIEAGDWLSRLWSKVGSMKPRDTSEVFASTDIASEAASRTFPRSFLMFVKTDVSSHETGDLLEAVKEYIDLSSIL